MWGNADNMHDEYVIKRSTSGRSTSPPPPERAKSALSPRTKSSAKRARTVSKLKRPPPRHQLINSNSNHSTHSNEDLTKIQITTKFRGRGRTMDRDNKVSLWTHPHDAYPVQSSKRRATSMENPFRGSRGGRSASPPPSLRRKSKTPNGKRPHRMRFDTETEEKSNHPLPPSKESKDSKPSPPRNIGRGPASAPTAAHGAVPEKKEYVHSSNIHDQYRSGYRVKPLPPDPRRRSNHQKVLSGKLQFAAMVKNAAVMEGVECIQSVQS